MMKRITHFLLCLWFALAGAVAWASEAPDVLIRAVATDVLNIVRQDKAIQGGDTRKAMELVENKVLPHFNFNRMTALAVGRDWRAATPEQKKQLVQEFRTLLVRTYSNALTQYKNQTLDWKPLKMQPSDTDVLVHSLIRKPGAEPIDVTYNLSKAEDGSWKVYDVLVSGVSLVTNYRDTFAQEVRNGGIDGLIRSLQAKNRAGSEGHK